MAVLAAVFWENTVDVLFVRVGVDVESVVVEDLPQREVFAVVGRDLVHLRQEIPFVYLLYEKREGDISSDVWVFLSYFHRLDIYRFEDFDRLFHGESVDSGYTKSVGQIATN